MRYGSASPFVLEALEPRLLMNGLTSIPGDANCDGVVDAEDWNIVKAGFGMPGDWSHGDFNADSTIDTQDFTILKDAFGQRVPDNAPGTEVTWRVDSYTGRTELVVLGTDGSDAVTVSRSGSSTILIASGQTHVFSESFTSVQVYGFGGDDLLVSISGAAESVWGGSGFDSFWGDRSDVIADGDAGETAAGSVHVVGEFYQPSTDPTRYVSMQIAGQDIIDPTASQAYADFSSRPLFVDGPELNDVAQGQVGDCYFMGALSSLAQADPGVIRHMMAPLGDGSYAVRFYRNGQEVYLRVDGDLPVSSGGTPVYAKLSGENELWVAIAEKAYAQFRTGANSYASLSGGWMDPVYREITGLTATRTYISGLTEAALASYISQNIQDGRAVSAGSYAAAGSPIVGNHAYAVQSIFSSGGQWYVTVYNVWGQDGRTWDSNYYDGLLTITLAMFKTDFAAVCVSAA